LGVVGVPGINVHGAVVGGGARAGREGDAAAAVVERGLDGVGTGVGGGDVEIAVAVEVDGAEADGGVARGEAEGGGLVPGADAVVVEDHNVVAAGVGDGDVVDVAVGGVEVGDGQTAWAGAAGGELE